VYHLKDEVGSEALKQRGRYVDFLDILLTARDETGAGLTRLEIRNEVDTFLFEGEALFVSCLCLF